MSSHDVVGRVRRALGERRVGHAGTLDPAASGVLVVGVGQGTRLMGMLTQDSKSYLAEIRFGAETDTDDAEGRVVREADLPARCADVDFARETVAALVGEHDQVPPAYSAISVGGERAYKRARAGEDVELEARHVTIEEATLVSVAEKGAVWTCAFRVSKGTYVRSIARDLGRSLGSAAHLCALRRTSSGSIGTDRCVSLERLEELGAAGAGEVCLDPADALGLPVRMLSERELAGALCGRALQVGSVMVADGCRVTLARDGSAFGVWRREGLRLRCVANFPAGVTGVRA
jgi:tRNA pseudouridine55 synthase